MEKLLLLVIVMVQKHKTVLLKMGRDAIDCLLFKYKVQPTKEELYSVLLLKLPKSAGENTYFLVIKVKLLSKVTL